MQVEQTGLEYRAGQGSKCIAGIDRPTDHRITAQSNFSKLQIRFPCSFVRLFSGPTSIPSIPLNPSPPCLSSPHPSSSPSQNQSFCFQTSSSTLSLSTTLLRSRVKAVCGDEGAGSTLASRLHSSFERFYWIQLGIWSPGCVSAAVSGRSHLAQIQPRVSRDRDVSEFPSWLVVGAHGWPFAFAASWEMCGCLDREQ